MSTQKFDLGDEGKSNQHYDEAELRPAGSGKQGDQQQMGQDREARKDKSNDILGSDKRHEDELGNQDETLS